MSIERLLANNKALLSSNLQGLSLANGDLA